MACVEHLRKVWNNGHNGNHDANVLGGDIEVVEAWPGHAKCTMVIKERHLNGGNIVHGGCIMTLVDDMTWLVLQTLGYPVIPSVSTNLSGEFVRPCGTLGDELTIVSEAVKKGSRLGFLRVTFYVKGQVCAFGSQTVALLPTRRRTTHTFTADGNELVPVEEAEVASRL